MAKKIFTAPAPGLTALADEIHNLGHKAYLGTPDDEDGVVIWIEVEGEGIDDAPALIVLAAEAWDDHRLD